MKTILIKPIITEHTMRAAKDNWYTFKVAKEVTKNQLASIVSNIYNVKVIDVRTVTVAGKFKRAGKKMKYKKQTDWKKASVHLSKGQTISLFEIPVGVESA